MVDTLPLTVLTGFLGSGKTTLLRHALRDPALSGTAVIVNEFGEIGLDHDLVESAEEDLVALTTGCLCCAVRGDLSRTIADLLQRRSAGDIVFERLVIETSGLADPAPIVQALALDADLNRHVHLAHIITTIDSLTGVATLANHPEARKQAAFADLLVLTKSDLGPAAPAEQAARAYNPNAPAIASESGRIDARHLIAPGSKTRVLSDTLETATDSEAEHSEGIATVTLVRESPIPAIALTLFLEALAEACGPDLLRVKGMVHLAEAPETPAVVHGVQHVFHGIEWLDRWPGTDRTTRMVFIGRYLMPGWPRLLLQQIEREVAAVADD